MNNIISYVIVVFLCGNTVVAQYLKLDNGILSTSYRNDYGREIADIPIETYAVSAGFDYFNSKWFYLSSQIGYTRIGGRQKVNPLPGVEWDGLTFPAEKVNYIHLNTAIRGQKKFENGLALFVGLGPYLNWRVGSDKFENNVLEELYELKSYCGGKAEVGFTFDVQKLRLGLSVVHLHNITPTAKGFEWGLELSNHNWGVFTSIGYRLFD